MLKTLFHDLIIQYKSTEEQEVNFWNEIETAYSAKERSYHTLTHIQFLINKLIEARPQIQDWNTLLFAAFYHDVVYHAGSVTNEEESAIVATDRMNEIMIPANAISHCTKIILATKSHAIHPDNDINTFLDADLAILGSDKDTYAAYAASIRKEYHMFDDAAYREGRKQVLDYFLSRPRIFITDHFNRNLEQQARANLKQELEQL